MRVFFSRLTLLCQKLIYLRVVMFTVVRTNIWWTSPSFLLISLGGFKVQIPHFIPPYILFWRLLGEKIIRFKVITPRIQKYIFQTREIILLWLHCSGYRIVLKKKNGATTDQQFWQRWQIQQKEAYRKQGYRAPFPAPPHMEAIHTYFDLWTRAAWGV